jgi:hypothetical protein
MSPSRIFTIGWILSGVLFINIFLLLVPFLGPVIV